MTRSLSSTPFPAPRVALRLGSQAPDFDAATTQGHINFHKWAADSWVVLFSHPEDFTPVCTTELGAFAKLSPEFDRRNVKLIGLSANHVDAHHGWISDIHEVTGGQVRFPIIGDQNRTIALLYDMIDYQDITNVDEQGMALTIRSVFIIDPSKTIRLILSYPASTGRNSTEILRVIDSLQLSDLKKVTTPVDWTPGKDVIVHPSVSDAEAYKAWPRMRIIKPYLRMTALSFKDSRL